MVWSFKLIFILAFVSTFRNIKTSAISIVKNSDNSRQDLFDRLYSNEYNLYKSNQVADERQLQNDNLNFPLYGDDDLMRDLISFNLDHNLRKKRRQFTNLDLCKNVNCNRIHSNGQVSKTWRIAQLVSCCPSLRVKSKIF